MTPLLFILPGLLFIFAWFIKLDMQIISDEGDDDK